MKFSIRDLFLVTAIVALVLGWGLDHWWQAVKEGSLIKATKDADDRFLLLRELVEADGSEVSWKFNENGSLQMMVGPSEVSSLSDPANPINSLPNSSAPAPNPPNP